MDVPRRNNKDSNPKLSRGKTVAPKATLKPAAANAAVVAVTAVVATDTTAQVTTAAVGKGTDNDKVDESVSTPTSPAAQTSTLTAQVTTTAAVNDDVENLLLSEVAKENEDKVVSDSPVDEEPTLNQQEEVEVSCLLSIYESKDPKGGDEVEEQSTTEEEGSGKGQEHHSAEDEEYEEQGETRKATKKKKTMQNKKSTKNKTKTTKKKKKRVVKRLVIRNLELVLLIRQTKTRVTLRNH